MSERDVVSGCPPLLPFVEPLQRCRASTAVIVTSSPSRVAIALAGVRALQPENDTKLRSTIIAHMLYSEQPAVIAERSSVMQQAAYRLDSELRSLIASSAVRHSQQPQQLIDELLAHYRATASSDLRQDVASAVTSTRDAASIRKLPTLYDGYRDSPHPRYRLWFVYLLRNRDARDASVAMAAR